MNSLTKLHASKKTDCKHCELAPSKFHSRKFTNHLCSMIIVDSIPPIPFCHRLVETYQIYMRLCMRWKMYRFLMFTLCLCNIFRIFSFLGSGPEGVDDLCFHTSAGFSPFGQRSRGGRWPMLSHIWEIFSFFIPPLKSQSRGLNSSLKAIIPVLRPNSSLEAQILASRPKS